MELLEDTIDKLNKFRDDYNNYDKKNVFYIDNDQQIVDKKVIWEQMIQLLPSSYNQTRNVMLNYEVLANIYKSRKNHKLDEWREFCKWIEGLPYAELITDDKLTKDVINKILDILVYHAEDRATLCDITDIYIWLEEERNILCNGAEYRSWNDMNNHIFKKED